jgi:uncharacterized membrane protein YidH (DUF202 family)
VQEFGKLLVLLGVVLTIVGGALWAFSSAGWLRGLGRLPGDIFIQRGNSAFYFPIVTCLLISAVLTLVMWLLRR